MENVLFFLLLFLVCFLISIFFNCKYAYSLLRRERENTDIRQKLDAAAYTGSLAVKLVWLQEWIQKAEKVQFPFCEIVGENDAVREALTLKLLPTTKNYFISHLLRIFHEVLHMWMHMVDDSALVFGILYPWLVMGSTILPTICAIPLTFAKQITAHHAGQKESKHNHMITNSRQSMKSCYQVIRTFRCPKKAGN